MRITIMTEQEIQKAIDAIPAMMNAKGLRQPEVVVRFNANEGITASARWDDGKGGYQPSGSEYFAASNASKTIQEILAWVHDLPSAEETKRNQFLSALGGVIDLGKQLGIDVDYVNPLRDTMKRLSENVITDQRSKPARADRQREAAE
jgi:hypothetical protein